MHTSVPFSLKHLEEDKEMVCTEYVLPIVRQILPELPEPDRYKSHKWRFSQVGHNTELHARALIQSPRMGKDYYRYI